MVPETRAPISEELDLPVVHAVSEAFKLWHATLPHMPRLSRYSLGEHIDHLFIRLLDAIYEATFAPRDQKLAPLLRASVSLDTLKLFLQLSWELRAIDTKNYGRILPPLAEAGKMLGGWQRLARRNAPGR